MTRKNLLALFILPVFVLNSCDFPYNPEPESSSTLSDSTTYANSDFKVFPLNGTHQVCNPSISQDTANFNGCMLWLNFSGPLEQNIPEQFSNYGNFAGHHDRITITDTSNTVRWFIKNTDLGQSAFSEIQDPEWSTHSDYLVCLTGSGIAQNWNCYAVHIPTKDTLNLCFQRMDAVSTPHLWVNRQSNYSGQKAVNHFDSTSGLLNRESVISFFGTDSVKLVFSLSEQKVLSLYYADYSDTNNVKPIKLNRPQNRDKWNFESPMISPDGKWIVYNGYENLRYYETYVQELAPGSKPILLGENICEPHWWVHPDNNSLTYIIYSSVDGGILVSEDLSDPKIAETGDAGKTFIQQVMLFPGRSLVAGFKKTGSPEIVINLPMRGGLSPSGEFICTGYERAYIAKLY